MLLWNKVPKLWIDNQHVLFLRFLLRGATKDCGFSCGYVGESALNLVIIFPAPYLRNPTVLPNSAPPEMANF